MTDPLGIPPDRLEALASLLEAIVPGTIADAPTGWSDGWRACCGAIRHAATVSRENPEEVS